MRVQGVLRRLWDRCAPDIHAARLGAVKAAVEGLAWGARLSVTGIGRGLRGSTATKHSIKRVDRLLSNPRVWSERFILFAAVARHLLAGVERPVIAVDWTQLVGGFHALVAAVPLFGRAIPVYLEVHPEKLLGNSSVEERFLHALKTVLPTACRPIIVSDAGYRTPFFTSVLAQGWDFVGRIRGRLTMQPVGQAVVTSKERAVPAGELQSEGSRRLYAESVRRRFRRSPRVGSRWQEGATRPCHQAHFACQAKGSTGSEGTVAARDVVAHDGEEDRSAVRAAHADRGELSRRQELSLGLVVPSHALPQCHAHDDTAAHRGAHLARADPPRARARGARLTPRLPSEHRQDADAVARALGHARPSTRATASCPNFRGHGRAGRCPLLARAATR